MPGIVDETLEWKKRETSPYIYDLRLSENAENNYFTQVAGFSDQVLDQAQKRMGGMLDQYMAYCLDVLPQTPTTRGEAVLDLLTVGAVTELYWDAARRVPGWVLKELQKQNWKSDRPVVTVKMLRDALSRTFIRVDRDHANREADRDNVDLEKLSHLIDWLQCTHDLKEAARCLVNWSSVLRNLTPADATNWHEEVWEFFRWFEVAADEAMGRYTEGVPRFLARMRRPDSGRPDRFLRGQQQAAYHLAMVAVEVRNREMRHAFERCPRKLVLLPACMRGASARTCHGGQSFGLDVMCRACDADCSVCKTATLLRLSEAEAYVENCPRASARLTSRWSREQGTGVVVVACLANMLSLQVQTHVAGMTCQFLPLDFPGCQSHWLKHRVPTTLNESELVRLVTGENLAGPTGATFGGP